MTGIAAIGLVSATSVASVPVARIVPGVGIGQVKLGQTKAEVRRELGPPSSPDAYGGTEWLYSEGVPGAPLGVSFARSGHVNFINIRSTSARTSKGVGLGSTQAEVKRAYPQSRCGFSTGSAYCYFTKRVGTDTVQTTFADGGNYVVQGVNIDITCGPDHVVDLQGAVGACIRG